MKAMCTMDTNKSRKGKWCREMTYLQTDEILIRDMETADLEELCKLSQDESEGTVRYFEKQFGHIREDRCAGLIAFYKGAAAGYVYLYYRCNWGGLGNQGYPGVVDLFVAEAFRRNGIGELLMDAAERIAAGYSDIVYLDVGLNREFGSAQRLYAKRGYIPDGKGCYYEEKVCGTDAVCRNSDELTMCLIKRLR